MSALDDPAMRAGSLPADPLAPVAEICKRHNVTCSAAEFQAAVNLAFHRFESGHYDDLHTDMWQSLPEQINLLAEDCLRAGAPGAIRMLDIGCGTGLATDCLLRTALAPKIETVDLLDTSSAMLARAQARRQNWGKPGDAMEGLVEGLVGRKHYNLIITCSVLHHVPDLASFLRAVAGLQEPDAGALFIHLQDPNADFLNDPGLIQRRAQWSAHASPEWLARLRPSRVFGRLMRELKGEQGRDYISNANRELIERGLIASPLSVPEVFAITDIHARDGEGISVEAMRPLLPAYNLVSRRSYGFFGALWSELPPALREAEQQAIREQQANGFHMGAVWRRSA